MSGRPSSIPPCYLAAYTPALVLAETSSSAAHARTCTCWPPAFHVYVTRIAAFLALAHYKHSPGLGSAELDLCRPRRIARLTFIQFCVDFRQA